jgi:hypothetical protein
MYHIFFVHLVFEGYLGCFYTLAAVNSAAVNMIVQITLQYLISVLCAIYPLVQLLDHMVVLFLMF